MSIVTIRTEGKVGWTFDVPDNRMWLVGDMVALLQTLVGKSHDYASETDDMENFRGGGLKGIYNRMGDKMQRLRNFIKHGSLSCEGFTDSCMDIAGYGFLMKRAHDMELSVEGDTWSEGKP